MKDTQDIQGTSEVPKSEVDRQEDKMEKQEGREDKLRLPLMKNPSSVHFLPNITSSDTTTLPLSRSLSHEMPSGYYLSSAQISGLTISTRGAMASKSTVGSSSRTDNSLEIGCFIVPKKQNLVNFDTESPVFGEGKDYFFSLFGDSKKLITCSGCPVEPSKHSSMILEEVGQSVSSSLGEIEIAEVNIKGLFVKLTNSSLDKELEIGHYILQQNVKGKAISLYRFIPNITIQANSSVTVWAAASEAKHCPPSDFLWKELNKFRTSPDCTTILCRPNGEAIAWYTPIHWKQAWEKLETDIEFDRCSAVTSTFGKHMFRWTTSASTITKENQDLPKREPSKCQVEQAQLFLKREKEIPPTLFPNRSPWCHSSGDPVHPDCPLIEPCETHTIESSSGGQPQAQSTRPDPGTKKKRKSKLQKQ